MPRLYRAMREATVGVPETGPSARTLGVRPGIDVSATASDEMVLPGQGGISVSPDDPLNLPSFRRPPNFQGTGRDPVFAIDVGQLGPDLRYRPDPNKPKHGFIEPARPMTLDKYQQAVAATQSRWEKVEPPPDVGSNGDGT
jgi:hypothetical protein